MSRFDCPDCSKSLRWRLLPHVPQGNGAFAFRCIHCGALLRYSEHELPIGAWFWKTRVRAVVTFLLGAVLLSGVASLFGRAVAIGLVALVGIVLLAGHLLSSQPAYRLLSEDANLRSRPPG